MALTTAKGDAEPRVTLCRQVMRVLTEERILSAVDHPFVANLYGTIQTDTHLHFLMVRFLSCIRHTI